ncbi:MAG: 50S ribosomal protein L25 [Candidatus Omnitrophota bacterium]
MEQVKLTAKKRQISGKREVKRQRLTGIIPGIVYGESEKPVPLFLDTKAVNKILHTAAGENVIVSLKVEGDESKKEKTCIVKEVQHNPLSGQIIHVDFNEISLTETIKVHVPLIAEGEPIGVVQDGGILEHLLREIEVECLPVNIPQKLTINVANMKIGDAMFIRDIVVSPEVKVLNDPGIRILAVEKPVEVKPEEAAAEEAATEPEVTKQKKEEPVEEGPAEKGKEKGK